ncbi:FtsX-like permease family protein [Conexibacter arvalis]|uniref:Putative ABC transport system permease protein n=1 Tax=Conexibacter arvalis TaxID=912552 RepID=A0A840IIQ6_9ACTN|nr:FtsX-like permease family protein [Conexibacter arvalis]MBB4664225.1 putative ABC transport system permease protein [Conexibacter arvalis]
MRLGTLPRGAGRLVQFYLRRLRRQWPQELLAGAGIAIGVALVFAVLVSNSSITGSAREVVEGITGNASIQLAARGGSGFDQATVERVRALPGVREAAPLLEQRATVAHGGRRAAVQLIGVDDRLPRFGGVAARNYQLGGLVLQPGLILPRRIADELAIPAAADGTPLPRIAVDVRGRRTATIATAVVGPAMIGPLADSILVVASLPYAQRLTGLEGRVTRVLVEPLPGREQQVRAGLEAVADGRLYVGGVDDETRLLEQATGPIDQATGLFAAIGAFVGLLFAFNAMLLTVPERRRFVATLRKLGYRRARIVQILGFQAVALGAVASLAGLAGGYLLARTVLSDTPSYLTFAFPIGIRTIVPAGVVAAAFAGGVVATCLAAAQPLADLRRGRPIDVAASERGEQGQALGPRAQRTLAFVAAALVAVGTLLALLVPGLTLIGAGALAAATVLAVPAALALALRLGDVAARRMQRDGPGGRGNMLLVAVRELRATTIRSLALAATGAVAIFGSVAIEGAHSNLVTGLDRNFADYLDGADLWVTTGGDENSLTTQAFDGGAALRRARAVPGVAAVRPYHGGMLDLDDRRAWVIGRPAEDRSLIPRSQLLEGDLERANGQLRAGGAVALSKAIADSLGAGLGDAVALPTPSGPRRFRVAAIVTNLGWGPGAIVMRAADYRRAWRSDDPTAFEVDLRTGADVATTRGALERALAQPALRVQTTAEREAQFQALARQGLERLTDISTLALIAAALAMAAAMGAGIFQRRVTFSRRRIQGYRPAKLRRILLYEATLILGTGCLAGALLGAYGHLLANRFLQDTTGYPAPFALALPQTVATCLLVLLVALALTSVPGWLVSRTPPQVGLETGT